MKNYLFILLWLTISCSTFAQKTKKIFSSFQEGNLQEAETEYGKLNIEEDKYSAKEDILLDIVNCLLMINIASPRYNPIVSIKNFKGIFIPNEEKEGIIKFLAKYELDLEMISERIHAENVFQAKKLNTVESYSNALQVCSESYRLELLQLKEDAIYSKAILDKEILGYKDFKAKYPISKYKDEIQSLLERKVLDIAKKNEEIGELNSFMKEYSNSKLNQEATDFRDSIALSKVPNEYDSMLAFTKEYPNSIFSKEIENGLSNLLFEQTKKANYSWESVRMFLEKYPNESKIKQIDSIVYFSMNKFSILNLENYSNLFIKGKYLNNVQNIRGAIKYPYQKYWGEFGADTKNTYSSNYFFQQQKTLKKTNCYINDGEYPQLISTMDKGTNKMVLNSFETQIQSKLKSNFYNLPKSFLKSYELTKCPTYSQKKGENEGRYLISSDYEIIYNGDTLISVIQGFQLTVWGGCWAENGLNVANFNLRNNSELKNLITKENINQLIGDVNSFFENKINKLIVEDSIYRINNPNYTPDYSEDESRTRWIMTKDSFIKDIFSTSLNDLQIFFYKGIPHIGYNSCELHRGSHFESYFIPLPSVQIEYE